MKHALGALLLLAAAPALAQTPPEESRKIAFMHDLPNIAGKKLIAVEVTYGPGAASPAHTHAPSSFIFAYVLSGAIDSAVDDAPVRTYHAGESWFEAPGAHHTVSRNASASEPARLLAVFVVDGADHDLVIPDHHAGQ
jgi:quercetin dioxygenase-like cupin family protein